MVNKLSIHQMSEIALRQEKFYLAGNDSKASHYVSMGLQYRVYLRGHRDLGAKISVTSPADGQKEENFLHGWEYNDLYDIGVKMEDWSQDEILLDRSQMLHRLATIRRNPVPIFLRGSDPNRHPLKGFLRVPRFPVRGAPASHRGWFPGFQAHWRVDRHPDFLDCPLRPR